MEGTVTISLQEYENLKTTKEAFEQKCHIITLWQYGIKTGPIVKLYNESDAIKDLRAEIDHLRERHNFIKTSMLDFIAKKPLAFSLWHLYAKLFTH